MRYFKSASTGFFVAAVFLISPSASSAEKIKIAHKFTGSFLTNEAGASLVQPPYIQIIRSADGLDYILARFERLRNRTTRSRIIKLRKKLSRVDYEKQMIIGVFSQPMDNYKITLKKVTFDPENQVIGVDVKYLHKIKTFSIPPKKSVHYVLVVIPKMRYPVILQAREETTKKKRSTARKTVTVTGRLMPLTGNDLQLVPVKVRKGSKNSYYIRGAQTDAIAQYIGKVITLKGTVSREQYSPYEFDFFVEKVVKVHR